MRLIGISGLAGSGKSTAAAALVGSLGFVEVSQADPMKRAVAEWFGWDEDRLWGPSANRSEPDPKYDGLTARKALQFLGTEIGRELYRNVWVDYAIRTAKSILADNVPRAVYERSVGVLDGPSWTPTSRGVVISDVRFRNELDAIQAAGGKVIRIVRPMAGLDGSAAMHASEVEQQGIPDEAFDAVLANAGTIERTHDPARIPDVVRWAREAGLQVSLDLIYGTPGETLDDWRRSLDAVLANAGTVEQLHHSVGTQVAIMLGLTYPPTFDTERKSA